MFTLAFCAYLKLVAKQFANQHCSVDDTGFERQKIDAHQLLSIIRVIKTIIYSKGFVPFLASDLRIRRQSRKPYMAPQRVIAI